MSRNAEVKVKARRPESSPFRAQETDSSMEWNHLREMNKTFIIGIQLSKSAARELSWSGPMFGRQIRSIAYNMIDQVLIPALAPAV